MKRNLIAIFMVLIVMTMIGASYVSADPKGPKKIPKAKPIHEMICTGGSAVDQVDCLKEYIAEVERNSDFVYKFNASNMEEPMKTLYIQAYQNTYNAYKSQLAYMAQATPPGSYGEIKFLRYKAYLMLKLVSQFTYMSAGPEQKIELD